MKKIKRMIASLVLSLGILTTSYTSYAVSDDITLDETAERYKEVVEHVMNSYYGEGRDDISVKTLFESAMKGIFKDLDKYSEYYTDEEFEKFMAKEEGISYGLGVTVTKVDEGVEITAISKDSSGEKAGLSVNDIILAVNGENIAGYELNDVVKLIKGEKDTDVTLIIKRAGSTFEVIVKRGEIKENPVASKRLSEITNNELDKDTIYMSLDTFNKNTTDYFDEELDKYDGEINKLILDLRNNPGGFMDEALEFCSYFLSKGDEIVSLVDKKGSKVTYKSRSDKNCNEVVILINNNSASASELTTGALKDHDRAIVVGEHSYGKSVAQTIFTYNGLNYKMTTEEYYTPNGTSIAGKGITPDIVVELPKSINDVRNKYFGGEKSEDIRRAKTMLKFLGYNITNDTDVYDPITKEQVTLFQANNGLGAYGGLDYTTQTLLNNITYEKLKTNDIQFEKACDVIRNFSIYKNEILKKKEK